jgi:hypothetical protein
MNYSPATSWLYQNASKGQGCLWLGFRFDQLARWATCAFFLDKESQ